MKSSSYKINQFKGEEFYVLRIFPKRKKIFLSTGRSPSIWKDPIGKEK